VDYVNLLALLLGIVASVCTIATFVLLLRR